MKEQTFLDVIRNQIKFGGATVKLITYNVVVFIFLGITMSIIRLTQGGFVATDLNDLIHSFFTLDTNVKSFFLLPITLITSVFSHFGLFHILTNMLMLYFSGKLFEQLFDSKRLIYTYIFGGILGGVFEIIAHQVFPTLSDSNTVIVGASGSVMAIFTALAFYRPNLTVNLFGVFPIRLIFLAGAFILMDLFALGVNDGTAHFAHLGGITFGFISVQNIHSKNNLVIVLQRFIESFSSLFNKKNPKFKVQKGGRTSTVKTDEEYNLEAKERQAKIDAILDKISKSGYESLTKSEKDFLFRQSQNGK